MFPAAADKVAGAAEAVWAEDPVADLAGTLTVAAEVVRSEVSGSTIWSEWEMRGTKRDGSAHLMRGVMIFGVSEGRASWARFYLEPVEQGGGDMNAFIRGSIGQSGAGVT